MTKFLTAEWVDTVREAINADEEIREAAKTTEVSVSQVITDVPDLGTVKYWFAFGDGKMENGLGDPPKETDATIQMNHATAKGLYTGDLKMQIAFMQGKVKVKGNMGKLLKSQSAMNGVFPIIGRVTSEY